MLTIFYCPLFNCASWICCKSYFSNLMSSVWVAERWRCFYCLLSTVTDWHLSKMVTAQTCCFYHLGCSLYIKTVLNFDPWPAQIVGWLDVTLQPMVSSLLRSLFTSAFHPGQKKTTTERHVWTLMLNLSLFWFHFFYSLVSQCNVVVLKWATIWYQNKQFFLFSFKLIRT